MISLRLVSHMTAAAAGEEKKDSRERGGKKRGEEVYMVCTVMSCLAFLCGVRTKKTTSPRLREEEPFHPIHFIFFCGPFFVFHFVLQRMVAEIVQGKRKKKWLVIRNFASPLSLPF